MNRLTPAQQRAVSILQGTHKLSYTMGAIGQLGIKFITFRSLVERGVLIELPNPRGGYWYALSNEHCIERPQDIGYTCPMCFGCGCSACDAGRIIDTDPARSAS